MKPESKEQFVGHTPEPWIAQHRTIQDGKGGSQRYHVLASEDQSIQICELPGWDEEDHANAILPASALALLRQRDELRAACKAALGVLEYVHYHGERGDCNRAIEQARQAVAHSEEKV